MKITKEQVATAMRTGHDTCPEGTCIHAQAFSDNFPQVIIEAERAAQMGEERGSPSLAAYYEGMHVGFALALLVMKEELENANPTS
jgi:hypothetical protein